MTHIRKGTIYDALRESGNAIVQSLKEGVRKSRMAHKNGKQDKARVCTVQWTAPEAARAHGRKEGDASWDAFDRREDVTPRNESSPVEYLLGRVNT